MYRREIKYHYLSNESEVSAFIRLVVSGPHKIQRAEGPSDFVLSERHARIEHEQSDARTSAAGFICVISLLAEI